MDNIQTPHWAYIILLAVMSVITFAAFGYDKLKAKLDGWRVPEKTLLGLALFGGGIGGYLGMRILRHKTKHWQFVYLLPLFAGLQIVLLAYLLKVF